MITGKNLIGNQHSARGNTVFTTFDPQLNEENEWKFVEASEEEIDAAVELAMEAFSEFSTASGSVKAAFLREIALQIEGLGDELIAVYCKESGLTEGRAKGERGRTCFQLRSFADLVEEGSWVNATIDTALPDRDPIPKPDIRKMAIPIGPIVVFGASNFPLAYSTAGGDTASALAAGCPVIVKSHPMHAATSELVAFAVRKAAKQTGMPEGVFSHLNSSGIEVGQALVKHPGIKGVGFTGSRIGGRALFDIAAQRREPIPVFAEMGSINPVVLLPEALEKNATTWARKYAASITLGTGQFCTNPGLLLAIKSEELKEFMNVLSEVLEATSPGCMLHPRIHEKYTSLKSEMIAGKEVETIADLRDRVAPNYAQQSAVTVSGNVFLSHPKLHQEVFGPFSMVVVCDNAAELERVISSLEGQLTGTLIAEKDEIKRYPNILQNLKNKVGRLIFNGVPTGVEVCPSMQHGGPYPASTDSRFGAVGIHAIQRWVRPMSYQNWPDAMLPEALKNANPLGISRLVNGKLTSEPL